MLSVTLNTYTQVAILESCAPDFRLIEALEQNLN